MLGKHHRLNLRDTENRELLRTGKKFIAGGIQGIYDFAGDEPRIAATIPKAVVPKATQRNKLRRQIFASLPEEFKELFGLRLVLRVRSLSQEISPEFMKMLFNNIRRDENKQ